MIYIHPVRVGYHDTDCYGIVWHGHYIKWMEDARVELLRELGWGYEQLNGSDVLLPVANIECKFRKSISIDQIAFVHCWVDSIGNNSAIFGYKIYNTQKTLLTDASIMLVTTDRKGKLLRRMPEALYKTLSENIYSSNSTVIEKPLINTTS